jgi:prepilin-type N-terminal cleavage/methylation domain-containing protein
MIYFLKNLRSNKLKAKNYKLNAGMTYVELIVVLSIFSVLSSVSIFSYKDFQARVDIKNLASDIAIKIVQAQKSSLSGTLPPLSLQPLVENWKPSYGVYFNIDTEGVQANPSKFVYFTDRDQSGTFTTGSCDECINQINITKSNTVNAINIFFQDGTNDSFDDLSIVFKRPDSSPIITSSGSISGAISYAEIGITSPDGTISTIKVYSSGRIQIN